MGKTSTHMQKTKPQFNTVTKEVEKHLKEMAAMLPQIPVSVKSKQKGEDLLKTATTEDLEGWLKDVQPDKWHTVTTAGAKQAVNHMKRMKSEYMRNGWEGVAAYIEPFRKKKAQMQETQTENQDGKGEEKE